MAIFTINEATCSKCGACVEVCHIGIIDFPKGGYPKPFATAEELCSKCGACLVVCPSTSLIHRDIPLDSCSPADPSLKVSFEQSAHLIKSRRSIRNFKDKPVSRENISRIIDAARYAPTGMNSQPVKWLVIDDKDDMQDFRKAGADFMIAAVKNSPRLAPLASLTVQRKEDGIDDFLHGAPAVVATYGPKELPGPRLSSIIALAYVDLAAIGLGLGCCWDGFFTVAANSYPPVKNRITLPEGNEIYGSLAIGYPKYKYHSVPMRNPANVTWK
jgi:nitroreductase/NAD-dependent dihydropyrimidine dehydrogenase PreA subunit